MSKIFTSLALKLHAFGLTKLQDPDWTGRDLYYHVKDCWKRREEPNEILSRTVDNGLLFKLGQWFFYEYINSEDYVHNLKGENLLWYIEDLYDFLVFHGAENITTLERIKKLTTTLNEVYEKDEETFYKKISSKKVIEEFIELHEAVCREYETFIKSVSDDYARNYAERVFHDRELCAYISELLIVIGFDGCLDPEDTEPKKWVDRLAIPEWAKDAIISRDRGQCTLCEKNLLTELKGKKEFDHIIPLDKGGCNDLVNYQLLCKSCNGKKLAKLIPVTSSIPPYLERLIKKRKC